MTVLSKNLRTARRLVGFTQQQAADEFNVSRGCIAQWEAATTAPEASRLPQIASFYRVSVGDLFCAGLSGVFPAQSDEMSIQESVSRLQERITELQARDVEPPMPKFWMVYGHGQREPTRRHTAFRLASDEAKRLAAQHPGITFTVLEAMQAFKAEKPRIVSIDVRESDDADDQIPF